MAQNKLQYLFITIPIFHTPISQTHLKQPLPLGFESNPPPLEKQTKRFAITGFCCWTAEKLAIQVKKCRWLLSPWRRWKKANTESYQQAWLPKFIVLLWAHSPERLLDSTNPQVNDLQQIITGTGQKLCSLRVQVQSCDPPKQLQFFYYAFSPRKRWGDSRGKKKKKKTK